MPDLPFSRLTDHVYWMAPGAPDRPSLCAVVGSAYTLMLDAGASPAHTQSFLNALAAHGLAAPRYVALTHWHWDHVFGVATLGIPVIASRSTADQLATLAAYDWSDAALDQRVASGEEIQFCADNIKLELPAPRDVQIAVPDVIMDRSLDFQLGGVTCHIQVVGGDHAADSCVMVVEPDQLVFLGDCLYDAIYTPQRYYTAARLFPLLDTILGFNAEWYVEGHAPTVMKRADMETMAGRMRLAGSLVERLGADEAAILAELPQPPDEDTVDFVRALIAGIPFTP